MEHTVVILMATYNGGQFLREQMKSIINQSFENWLLVIRDDGSTDETVAIIREFEADPRISYISTPYSGHSACANFAELYHWAIINLPATYIMFSDQDDIWMKDKVLKSLAQIQEMERISPGIPLLLYGNLSLINDNSEKLNDRIVLLEKVPFNKLLVQNNAFGCTMIFNKELCKIMTRIPHQAENHDYWVTMVATAFGQVGFIKEPLILYRQHSANVSLQGSSFKSRYNKYIIQVDAQIKQFSRKIKMFTDFLNHYQDRLDDDSKHMLINFIHSYTSNNALNPIAAIVKHRLYRDGILQNAAMFYMLLRYHTKIRKLIDGAELVETNK